jgi:hypothetical protein
VKRFEVPACPRGADGDTCPHLCVVQWDVAAVLGAVADMHNRGMHISFANLDEHLVETPVCDIFRVTLALIEDGMITYTHDHPNHAHCSLGLSADGWTGLRIMIEDYPDQLSWAELLPMTFGDTGGVGSTWEAP